MVAFMREHGITKVIDSSHPFATEVSMNAIGAAAELGVPYLRFERKNEVYEGVLYFEDYERIIEYLQHTTGSILLTIGSKNIGLFSPLGTERLYARVLPVASSIKMCEEAGLLPGHIIGLCGSLSVNLNKAFLEEFMIKYMVTKESGEEGGLREKTEAARQYGTEILVLKRPRMDYPEVFYAYGPLLERLNALNNC